MGRGGDAKTGFFHKRNPWHKALKLLGLKKSSTKKGDPTLTSPTLTATDPSAFSTPAESPALTATDLSETPSTLPDGLVATDAGVPVRRTTNFAESRPADQQKEYNLRFKTIPKIRAQVQNLRKNIEVIKRDFQDPKESPEKKRK